MPDRPNTLIRGEPVPAGELLLEDLREARIYCLDNDPGRLILQMIGSAKTTNFVLNAAELAHLAERLSIDAELLLQGKTGPAR